MIRKDSGRRGLPTARIGLAAPSPAPGKRWTKHAMRIVRQRLRLTHEMARVVSVCVPEPKQRIRQADVVNTVYSRHLPRESFVPVGGGFSISCPELLFVEAARSMTAAEHLALGHELCGCFVRDAADDRNGPVDMGVPPVASRASIGRFLERSSGLAGSKNARRTFRLLSDNAWSPMESAIAAVMSLPVRDGGYGIGRCTLNMRVRVRAGLEASAFRSSRVPDILVEDTCVGINYDGTGHLDLQSVARAAEALGRDPHASQRGCELREILHRTRAKMVDDMRRNRELAADGLVVFPMTKEDLYEYGALDRVMAQVLVALHEREGWDVAGHLDTVWDERRRSERYSLLRSLIPGGQ